MQQIVILAPANAETGGVEDLHQLYGALQRRDLSVYMAYVNNSAINDCTEWNPSPFLCNNVIRQRYLQYADYKQTLEIPDSPETVVVAPEIYQRALLSLKHAKPCVWFLAAFPLVEQWAGRAILPLVQSKFAYDTIHNQGRDPLYLTDYLSPQIIPNPERVGTLARIPAALYYGGRGREEAEAMLKEVPVIGRRLFDLTAEQLSEAFLSTRCFFYPTRQPGMDKTPREAAVNGCVVFVYRMGAAEYYEDVPLPSRFICDSRQEMQAKLAQVTQIDSIYEADFAAQAEYRQWIRAAKDRFEACVDNFVIAIE